MTVLYGGRVRSRKPWPKWLVWLVCIAGSWALLAGVVFAVYLGLSKVWP